MRKDKALIYKEHTEINKKKNQYAKKETDESYNLAIKTL